VGTKEERRGTSPWLIFLVVLIAVVFLIGGILLALGTGSRVTTSPPPSSPASVPVINSFVANSASITAGSSSTLDWDVSGATSVAIDEGIGSVPASGNTEAKPSFTTTYTLTATNAAGSVTRSVTITVSAAPSPPAKIYDPSLPTGMGAFRGKVLWGDRPVISGTVIADTKHPLIIALEHKRFSTETDDEGNYLLIVEPGRYYFSCGLPGSEYVTYERYGGFYSPSHDVECGEVVEVGLRAIDWSIELVSPGDTYHYTDSTITKNPPTLVWKEYDWAKYGEVGYYQVELGIYEDGYHTVLKSRTESASYVVPSPLKAGKYSWEVRAYVRAYTEKGGEVAVCVDEFFFLAP